MKREADGASGFSSENGAKKRGIESGLTARDTQVTWCHNDDVIIQPCWTGVTRWLVWGLASHLLLELWTAVAISQRIMRTFEMSQELDRSVIVGYAAV